jgi:small conductance mechanosensitive channel
LIDWTIITDWLELNLMNIIFKLVLILIVWIVARIFIKKFDKIIIKKFWPLLRKLGLTRRKFSLLDDIMDITIYIIAITLTLYILELTSIIYTALTAAGVVGLVVGFAVKEIASNMISGILIKLNQPFIEGDSIKIEEKYKGTVTKVSLYYTDIVDYQGIVTSLPNALVISKPLTNFSKQTERLINITVSISKDADIDKALEILKKIAKNEKNRLVDRNIDVFVNNIREYIVDLSLRFWVSVKNFSQTKRSVIKEIAKQFKKNKIELAVPMRKTI